MFEASGLEFLIIHLDYTTAAGVNQAVIDWADALMKAYPRRRAIVTSHWILDLPPTSPIGASAPFGGPGQRFFDEFKDNPNLFLMLSGHQHGEGRRTDVFSGRTIYTVLQDYQERANGGNGWLRYFVFSPANNTITAKTYSPTLDQFESDTDATSSPRNQASEFVLPYNMQTAVAPWTVLGTVNVAAGGGSAQFNWTGLEEGSTYEWYVGASDGVTTTTSPVRIFSTADTAAPTVFLTSPANNAMFTTPTDITLTATASDTAGTIAKVEFFADATKLGEDTTSPYSFTWTNAPAGSYSLTARATDDDNATTTSSAVAITVQSLLSVNDATVGEGAGTATFTVTLSAASSQTVTVAYATAPGTASTGDYVTTSGTVTFSPGQTTQPVVVPIVNDILVESAETFTVGLSAPTNATISDGTGIGTIQDDDVSVSALSVNDVTVGEGAGTATFTVTLSAASSQTVTVAYATAPGTASTGDYVTTSGTVTFSPGQTTQPVVVPIVNDILVESAETFTVGLSAPTNATIADGTGQATITDDDMAGGTPVTVTVQIAAGGDDVNQDGTALATGVSGVWLGTASSTTSSYAGLRFVNLTVPRNATVTSARLEVNAAATQWQTMAFEYAIEAAANSAAFATTSLPGSRTLLTPRVNAQFERAVDGEHVVSAGADCAAGAGAGAAGGLGVGQCAVADSQGERERVGPQVCESVRELTHNGAASRHHVYDALRTSWRRCLGRRTRPRARSRIRCALRRVSPKPSAEAENAKRSPETADLSVPIQFGCGGVQTAVLADVVGGGVKRPISGAARAILVRIVRLDVLDAQTCPVAAARFRRFVCRREDRLPAVVVGPDCGHP